MREIDDEAWRLLVEDSIESGRLQAAQLETLRCTTLGATIRTAGSCGANGNNIVKLLSTSSSLMNGRL